MFYEKKFFALTLSFALLASAVQSSPVLAQDTAGASTPKQVAKAQRKADRKAARVKKNGELRTLEKNGYDPAGNQLDYPQNLQNAEAKAKAVKPASAAQ